MTRVAPEKQTRPLPVSVVFTDGERTNVSSKYLQKLLDPRWQKKRLAALVGADWACQSCGNSESTLHVHHKQYFKGREPWEYEVDQLAVLCADCHKESHADVDILQLVASFAPMDGPCGRVSSAWLLSGYLGLDKPSFDAGAPWSTSLHFLGELVRSMDSQINLMEGTPILLGKNVDEVASKAVEAIFKEYGLSLDRVKGFLGD